MRTLLLLLWMLPAARADQEVRETVRQTLPAAARLEVDNVQGYIHVSGYNGNEIQMVAEKTIRAESAERLEAAKQEVKLDVSRAGDTLTLFVDGPFRCLPARIENLEICPGNHRHIAFFEITDFLRQFAERQRITP